MAAGALDALGATSRPRASARRQPSAVRRLLGMGFATQLCILASLPVATQANIDGGRSELPGMRQDIFDQVQKNKKGGPQPRGRGPPDCPKSDGMSPFLAVAFASGEMYVRVNSSSQHCVRLVSVGGANYTTLINASRTCGPAGEWKRRIAENLSSIFFQGGLDWVKSENETLEVITEDGVFQAFVNEENYAEQLACWKKGCGCEQANNPIMRAIFIAIGVISIGGLSWDSVKLGLEKLKGKKPPKHVECKKGHRMGEVKFAYNHLCDVCGKAGTAYQCSVSCNYDMCKVCYKAAKKKVKTTLKEWLEKHPDDPDNKKKSKDDNTEDDSKKDDSDGDEKKSSKCESEAESKGDDATTPGEDDESGREKDSTAGDDEGEAKSSKSPEAAAAGDD
eukprot:CAMPEP_0170581948 /NCGR_PEP_ID=MMETSP0224-20130122/7317_1 /TAXON_ID=285029 /ORGANISM="Togula jolla, Strain CCCM 725" /LENGTH=392 /DNA_ID=CAMNT_0010905129 /DNA_START=1 /DNA_END=1179 /DNA_ORIENTATION=+